MVDSKGLPLVRIVSGWRTMYLSLGLRQQQQQQQQQQGR
jgi:hypothetical protein